MPFPAGRHSDTLGSVCEAELCRSTRTVISYDLVTCLRPATAITHVAGLFHLHHNEAAPSPPSQLSSYGDHSTTIPIQRSTHEYKGRIDNNNPTGPNEAVRVTTLLQLLDREIMTSPSPSHHQQQHYIQHITFIAKKNHNIIITT